MHLMHIIFVSNYCPGNSESHIFLFFYPDGGTWKVGYYIRIQINPGCSDIFSDPDWDKWKSCSNSEPEGGTGNSYIYFWSGLWHLGILHQILIRMVALGTLILKTNTVGICECPPTGLINGHICIVFQTNTLGHMTHFLIQLPLPILLSLSTYRYTVKKG